MNTRSILLIGVALIMSICYLSGQSSAHKGQPKFEPEDGKVLLVLGQDLGAVGGLNSYSNGYVDNITDHLPAGVTTYTNIASLDGLINPANWGSGDVNAQQYLQDQDFDNAVICIGLYMVNSLQRITNGELDGNIASLGQWIKNSNRPIFLRIGYEFDGPWNGYNSDDFKAAWKYIVHEFDELDVRNVAYVWQSAGINTPNINRWYPGDEYVNWLGYSHFEGSSIGTSIKDFAKEHSKPIMIAEATPRRDLKVGSGQGHWDQWFAPLFSSIYANDNIKMLAYISADWDNQPMWKDQGWGDSRIQVNQVVEDLWLGEINKDTWITGYDGLFDELKLQSWLGNNSTSVIDENNQKSNYTIYENESSVMFQNQKSEKIQVVKVFDLQGRIMQNHTNINNSEFRLDKSNLSKGLALVVITSENNNFFIKMIFVGDQ